jgi:hypothetical protein
MNRSVMSLRRHVVPFIRYSDVPSRKRRRPIVTSAYSVGSTPSVFSIVSSTSAMPSGRRSAVPLKMRFSIFSDRSTVGRCSPMTQRMASTMFDLPHPFGPTMVVTPGSNVSVVSSAKLLKPCSSSLLRYMCPRGRRQKTNIDRTAGRRLGRGPPWDKGELWGRLVQEKRPTAVLQTPHRPRLSLPASAESRLGPASAVDSVIDSTWSASPTTRFHGRPPPPLKAEAQHQRPRPRLPLRGKGGLGERLVRHVARRVPQPPHPAYGQVEPLPPIGRAAPTPATTPASRRR